MKITIQGFVEATLTNTKSWEVKTYKTKNTLVQGGEDFIAALLSKSLVLSAPYGTTGVSFVDYMSLGAGYKLAQDSVSNNEIFLPYDFEDGSEDSGIFNGCTLYCTGGPNDGESVLVATGGYNAATRKLTLASSFTNVPLIGETYVISPIVSEVQLQGEGEQDVDGNTILHTKQPVIEKLIHSGNLTNEVEIRSEWSETEGNFIASECGLRYGLTTNTSGESSTHTHPGNLFARATFGNNPPKKTSTDILQVRWTIKIGVVRA